VAKDRYQGCRSGGDLTTVTWDEDLFDLMTTYNAIFAPTRSRSFGGDSTGPVARTARFVRTIEIGASDGEWDTNYRLAVYEATFGKPTTVIDYTQLGEQRRPLPGSIHIPSFTAQKDGHSDLKKKASFDASSKDKEPSPTRMFVPKWQCGQILGGTMCAKWNHYYVTGSWNKSDTFAAGKCSLKKENSKCHPVKESSLGAAAINRGLRSHRSAKGDRRAADIRRICHGRFAQADYLGNALSLGLGGIVAESISFLNECASVCV